MKAIEVKNLSKTFKTKVKETGLKGSLKAIIKPKYNTKKAVIIVASSVGGTALVGAILFFVLKMLRKKP